MILLTNEEIDEVCGVYALPCSVPDFREDLLNTQLKKFVEWLLSNSTIHSMDTLPPILTYMIDGDKVQSRLDEVK